jgi:hypothetical protein
MGRPPGLAGVPGGRPPGPRARTRIPAAAALAAGARAWGFFTHCTGTPVAQSHTGTAPANQTVTSILLVVYCRWRETEIARLPVLVSVDGCSSHSETPASTVHSASPNLNPPARGRRRSHRGRNQTEKDAHGPIVRAEPPFQPNPRADIRPTPAPLLQPAHLARDVREAFCSRTFGKSSSRFTRIGAFCKNHGQATGGPGDVKRRRAHRGGDSASAGRAAETACLEAGSSKCSWEARPYKAGSLSSYGTAHDGD